MRGFKLTSQVYSLEIQCRPMLLLHPLRGRLRVLGKTYPSGTTQISKEGPRESTQKWRERERGKDANNQIPREGELEM